VNEAGTVLAGVSRNGVGPGLPQALVQAVRGAGRHRLKNAYRKAYRREPQLKRPVTEEDALRAISFLEGALREAGAIPPDEESPASAVTAKRRRHR
jgi:hypothetical protein